MMELVFQYGSNCSSHRLNGPDRLEGEAVPMSIAETVENMELSFDVWSKREACAAADLIPFGRGSAWGVLYRIPEHRVWKAKKQDKLKTLEEIEAPNYRPSRIHVKMPDGEVKDAWTFVVRTPVSGLKTSFNYVGFIICGLREHGAPQEYIQQVKKIAGKNNPCLVAHLESL